MRGFRIAAVITMALALGSAVPATAEPGAYAGGGGAQEAYAGWIFMTSRTHGVYYFADAWRSVDSDGVFAQGAVGKGPCHASYGKGFTLIICMAVGRGQDVSLDQFQMDPGLRSASLDMKIHGQRQHVEWQGAGDPGFGEYAAAGAGWAQAGASDARAARPKGHILGRDLAKRGMPFAFLTMGAGVGAEAWTGATLERSVRSDGLVRYRFAVRIPNR